MSRASGGQPALGNGTPEQVHLTWGDDPAASVVVSWVTPGRAVRPRVRIGQRVTLAQERSYVDARSGKTVWAYHAVVAGLRPGATYGYAVTADNDASAQDPFTSTFRTAPTGRAAFRFTSSGDLGLGPAALVAGSVESFQPLFHLMNGGLSDAGAGALGSGAWREFGNDTQVSAASRPWLPVPGRYQADPDGGRRALTPYLSRYALPSDGSPGAGGRWYSFRVGTAVFVCLDSNLPGGRPPDARPMVEQSYRARGYRSEIQTRWLEGVLAQARGEPGVDWLIAALHHPACCSVPGSDLGIRQEWLPLFDEFEVDLVIAGHAGGYERSFPCRGHDLAATRRPHPVTTEAGVLDTSLGTVHLTLGHLAPQDSGSDGAARVDMGGGQAAVEQATWSARRERATGHGIAVFDVSPGTEAGVQASIAVSVYRTDDAVPGGTAPGGPGAAAEITLDDLTEIERFTLVRPRPGRRRPERRQQLSDGAGVVGCL
jgi:hypothetical protein